MNFRKRPHEEPEINLIPFIDVLMVILIFLMLTTTYSKFTELQLQLPVANADAARDYPKEVVVSVSSDGRYAVNQVELYPFFQQAGQRAYDQAHGIITEAWSPLGHANQMLKDPTIVRIAAMDNPEGRSFA